MGWTRGLTRGVGLGGKGKSQWSTLFGFGEEMPCLLPFRFVSQDGNRAIDLAMEQGNKKCVQILEEAGEESSLWMSTCQEELKAKELTSVMKQVSQP